MTVPEAQLDTALNGALALARTARQLPAPAERRALREAAGLTQEQVAKATGVSPEAIGRYESGDRTPRGDVLLRYTVVLERLAAESMIGAGGESGA